MLVCYIVLLYRMEEWKVNKESLNKLEGLEMCADHILCRVYKIGGRYVSRMRKTFRMYTFYTDTLYIILV